MQNRVFFPQSALDEWIVDGAVELTGSELTIVTEARRYVLAEAVHVVTEVTGGADTHDLLGRVKSKEALVGLGAELLETSMILGEGAYDVLPGWIGTPVGSFVDHMKSDERNTAQAHAGGDSEPKSEEELLTLSLLKKK